MTSNPKAVAVIACLALGASAPALADGENQPAPAEHAFSIWIQPLGTAVFLASAPDFQSLYLSGGAAVSLTPRLDVVAEAAYARFGGCLSGGALGAFGIAYRPYGEAPMRGLFIQSKVLIESYYYTTPPSSDSRAPCPGPKTTLYPGRGMGVGLDVGYGFVWKHLYVAPIFGLTMALGGTIGTLGMFRDGGFFNPVGPGVNLNLFRAGAVF
ncbi:MAG: hypothetical protein ACYC8T_12180 [Myxococcaceae bacterium]